ncbi:MAG: response regulator [Akkermansiaceae bacterium]|nr:response regulator [Verrucomicrobiales bacterium]
MKKTILLADDSNKDAEEISQCLKAVGVLNPVVRVTDGEDVIAYLKRTGRYASADEFPKPAVLLLDLKMPKVNGFEVLQWIRLQPALKELLVIVISGSDGLKEVAHAYSLGANSFIVKPANPSEISNLVRSFQEYWITAPVGSQSISPHLTSKNLPGTNQRANG